MLADELKTNQMMKKSLNSKGQYVLSPGYYYVRVVGNKNNFVPGVYGLSVVLEGLNFPAQKIVLTGYDSVNGPNDYPNYPGYGKHYRFKDKVLTINGQLADNAGHPAKEAGVAIDVVWESGFWAPDHDWGHREKTTYTDSDGKFSVTFDNMGESGCSQSVYLPGAISFTHYFDLSGVVAKPKFDNYTAATDILFHFGYSIYNG